jgi:hypothetical protein
MPAKEFVKNNAAGLELGFNKVGLSRSGVSSCCSFIWAIGHVEFAGLNRTKNGVIINEYGDLFTFKQFLEILKDCPVQYYHNIGINFS